MNLHYSQTDVIEHRPNNSVLLPYEFTLLSNIACILYKILGVLLPYEFTLLSNLK